MNWKKASYQELIIPLFLELWYLCGDNKFGGFSTLLYLFCNFLFVFLHTNPLLKRSWLYKERFTPCGSKFLKKNIFKTKQNSMTELPPLKVYRFPLSKQNTKASHIELWMFLTCSEIFRLLWYIKSKDFSLILMYHVRHDHRNQDWLIEYWKFYVLWYISLLSMEANLV